MKLSTYRLIEIIKKEFITNIRQRAIFATMTMFALTTLACISLAIQGAKLEAELLSALLWIIIFFASTAVNQVFDDEAIVMLKVYGESQIILFGKMIYALLSMFMLMIFLVPTFIILFDCDIAEPLYLIITIILGICGIAVAGTMISALVSVSSFKSGLFPILLFPLILPIFLLAIDLTTSAFIGGVTADSSIIAMLMYDAILTVAASILFDYLWY